MSNIQFTDQEILDILQHSLTGPHKDLLTEAVFYLVADTDWKKALLLKATLGNKPKSEYRLHEQYLVRFGLLSAYDRDDAQSKAAGLIREDDFVECILVGFHPWQDYQYEVQFSYINDKGATVFKTDKVKGTQILIAEEFPEDYDDLPF